MLLTWFLATRPQFFTITILPIILGTAVAWYTHHVFSPHYFALSLLAGLFAHASINVFNDYFDHLNQTDDVNQTPLTPYAGGSRMIQNGWLSARQTYYYALVLLLITIIIGIFLIWTRGVLLLGIGLIGVLSGYCYSAPPFSLQSRGLGELLVGVNFGVLIVIGAFYVQTQTITLSSMIAALPLAFMVAAILFINEYPDYIADKKTGKKNLVVRIGTAQARPIYWLLIASSFFSILLGVLSGQLPVLSLLSLLTIPYGIQATKIFYRYYEKPTALIPAIKITILLHALISLILIIAFFICVNC
jgi:1,4-dihydroxy-2-naphthoate octaprenyltransferase